MLALPHKDTFSFHTLAQVLADSWETDLDLYSNLNQRLNEES